jgi:PAS domain S-box-containing protein
MPRPYSILHIEDNIRDAELIHSMLLEEGFNAEFRRVDSRDQLLHSLGDAQYDLILCDFNLPSFDGLSALDIAHREAPEVPFIFVSGAIGEDRAIESLKRGATDYVLKNRLARLLPSVRRALEESEARTERKTAEARMFEQAELLDISQDVILVRGLNEEILFWNKGAQFTTGYTIEELRERGLASLYKPEHMPVRDEALNMTLSKGTWFGELKIVTKQERELTLQSRWSLVRNSDGSPKSILIVNTDVTEQRRLQSQLLRTQRMESLGTLAGGIAHDLNNVLSPIILAVDVLKRKGLDEPVVALLDVVATSARRGADIVKQVLMFSRGYEGDRMVIQLKQIIKENEKFVRETFPKSIEVSATVEGTLNPVKADPTQIYQVLLNLCVNARDAMPRGGVLTIDASNVVIDKNYASMNPNSTPGSYVMLSVQDTGTGIPQENIDLIFEPFFTTKERGKGTGFGLSTVAAIVKGHGGFIEVQSRKNEGTLFKIFIPSGQREEEFDVAKKNSSIQTGGGEMILVVDDEASIREMTKVTLETYGYHVITASDGAEAILVFSNCKEGVGLVLTDMMMPVLDGPALVRTLGKLRPDLRVITMSGVETHREESEHLKPFMKAFLHKPFTATDLVQTIQTVLQPVAGL